MIRNGQVVVDQPLSLAKAGAVLEHRGHTAGDAGWPK